jgi:triacylglycerol lipase
MSAPSPASRLHVIFVPGFGAFDMLGQLEYYAGTTHVFDGWLDQSPRPWGTRIALHYFDNLPTAGVGTRATRLRSFITKRILRHEIQAGDRIALIGHSTGGLDIRHLLLELVECGQQPVVVAGVEGETIPGVGKTKTTSGAAILDRIACVVFLSVPQRGTNIANWTRANELIRRGLVWVARTGADRANEPGFEKTHVVLTRLIESLRKFLTSRFALRGLTAALQDINAETALRLARDPAAAADGREALADLELWLGHTHDDFLAIDDLACAENPKLFQRLGAGALHVFDTVQAATALRYGPTGAPTLELARRSEEARAEEQKRWAEYGISIRSYATRSPPGDGHAASDEDQVRSLKDVLRGALGNPKTDLLYRLAYRACAAGPFRHAQVERTATSLTDGAVRTIEAHENDGIVNTASMLWPNGEQTFLVEADHADIIGHYENGQFDPQEKGRKRNRYDILGSNSGFREPQFKAVWEHIFEYCASVA